MENYVKKLLLHYDDMILVKIKPPLETLIIKLIMNCLFKWKLFEINE